MAIKTVVYIDVLLLVNFIIALFLLLVAGALSGRVCAPWRLMLGGVVASLCTLVLFAPELPFLVQLIYQGSSAALVILAVHGRVSWRCYLRLVGWYYLANLLLAGLVTACLLQRQTHYHGLQSNNLSVYCYVSPRVLIGCVIGVYLTLRLFLACFGVPQTLPAQWLVVKIGECQFAIRAFYDTGFAVRDVFSGRCVLLVSLPALAQQLPTEWVVQLGQALSFVQTITSTAPLPDCAPKISQQKGQGVLPPIRYLACGTVAGAGMLPALCADCVYQRNAPQYRMQGVLVAFCGENSFCGDCNALFGSDIAAQLIEGKEQPVCMG